MIKELIVEQPLDEYDYIFSQIIYDTEDDILFSVRDLTDCPEDAKVCRDLFDASQYIDALNKGIELAAKGYTKVIGKYMSEEL